MSKLIFVFPALAMDT